MQRLFIQLALTLAMASGVAAQAQPAATSGATATPAAAASASSGAGTRAPLAIAPVDDAWRASLPRDAKAATQAYLDRLPPEAVKRGNDYYEGGYWLQLGDFLLGLAIAALMLQGRRAARVRDWSRRIGRKTFVADALFGGVYALAGWVLSLPLTVYQGFVREHAYGMATQGLGAWSVDQLVGAAVNVLITMLAVPLLYAVIRRSGERWWLTGTAVAMSLLVLMVMVGPVLIHPLFNTYKPVEAGPVKSAVLAMARANGVPVDNVYEFDASRQTTRISANVSGLFGTAAIRLNDNLLRRASLPEIRAVMAHEMGHYVMNHVVKLLCQFALLALLGFLFSQWAMTRLLQRFGPGWDVARVTDVASLPLLVAVFSVFLFFATPLANTIIRSQETEADYFSLNLAREPHGMAEAHLKVAEYRKTDPGAVEEFLFFDHPSARHRIFDAMRWREAMGTP